MELIKSFENILTFGQKTTSYKFALLTAIVDYVIENPTEIPRNNFHFIPIFYVAKQYLAYYFPLALLNIPQSNNINMQPKITSIVENLSESSINKISFSLNEISNTSRIIEFIDSADRIPFDLINILREIRNIILDQPLQYIQNVRQEKNSIFSLFTKDVSAFDSYDEHRKKGKFYKSEIPKDVHWDDLLKYEKTFIVIDSHSYNVLANYRFWFRDSIIKRWIEYSEKIAKRNNLHFGETSIFELYKSLNRDNAIINHYKKLYSDLGLTECLYTGNNLKSEKLHIDHFYPWSLLPVNRFWNLYPSEASINIKKSNKIPIISPILKERIENHLEKCLKSDDRIVERDVNFLYERCFGSSNDDKKDSESKINEIFGHINTIWHDLDKIIPGERFSF